MISSSRTSTQLDSSAALTAETTIGPVTVGAKCWSKEDFLPALSGLMTGLAFPPINFAFFSFIGLVPLFMYLDQPPSRARIIRASFIFPAAFYGFTLNWIAGMAGFSWLAVPAFLLIIFVYACGFFVFTLPVVLLKKYLAVPFLAAAPFAWVACEALRSYGDLAFPWCTLGGCLARFPFLAQFADIGGVFGLSFWLVVLNVLTFEILSSLKQRSRLTLYATAWAAVFVSFLAYDAVRWIAGTGEPLPFKEVSVIQPNIPQELKWAESYSRQVLNHVFTMNTEATKPSTDLVIWPETAIPYYLDEHHAFHLGEMGKLPLEHAFVLTGLLLSSENRTVGTRYFNAAALFDPAGDMLGRYKKIYLVPVSEEFPFRRVFGFARAFFSIQDISYGAMERGTEFTVFQIPGAKFSVMICYESVYPELARRFRLAGANFLVNITNDAWFGHSFAPYQHASFLTLRAIENRTAIVRCGNTGISGFVDPLGRWQQTTAIFTQAIISQKVPLTNQLTFYTHFGDLIVYVSYAALVLYSLMALRKKIAGDSEDME